MLYCSSETGEPKDWFYKMNMGQAFAATILVVLALLAMIGRAEALEITRGTARVDRALPERVRKYFADDDGRPLKSVAMDLNEDGVPEKFVPNEFLCGNGGCPWLVYDQKNARVIGAAFGSSIGVTETFVNGYRVLEARGSLGNAVATVTTYQFSRGEYRKRVR